MRRGENDIKKIFWTNLYIIVSYNGSDCGAVEAIEHTGIEAPGATKKPFH